MYLSATAETFGEDLDYAMVVKKFKSQPKPENVKYSPAAGVADHVWSLIEIAALLDSNDNSN
jgi:hypothetical protein